MAIQIRSYKYIIAVALAISLVSTGFTVFGMRYLFAGATIAVTAMVIALEAGKITIAGGIVYGVKSKTRKFLVPILICLVGIAGAGHFGFLTEAYNENRQTQVHIEGTEERTEQRITRLQSRYDDIQDVIRSFPQNYPSARLEYVREVQPEINSIMAEIDSLNAVEDIVANEIHKSNLNIGPMRHLAEAFNLSQDTVARSIAIILALIIDPLALLLFMTGVEQFKPITTTSIFDDYKEKKKKKKTTGIRVRVSS